MLGKVLNAYKRGIHDSITVSGAPEFPEEKIVAQIKAVLADKKGGRDDTTGIEAAAAKATTPNEASMLLLGCYGPGALQNAVKHVEKWEQRNLTHKSEVWLSTIVEQAALDDPVAEAKDAAKEGAFDGLK